MMQMKSLGCLAAVVLGVVGSAWGADGEIVLFDAAKASVGDVRPQDGATFALKEGLLTVTTKPSDRYPGVRFPGAWDLSRIGRVEVEFVNGGIWGKYTLRLLNAGGNPGKGTGCWIQKLPIKGEKAITLGADFEPFLPEWQKVLPLLTRVRTWALPYMIWAKNTGDIAVWNHPAAAHGSLDRTAVKEVAVYINTPRLPHTWSIRRIVAKGCPASVGNVPAFAKLPPEKFFPCIDEYGQFKHREWPGKVHSDADLKAAREAEAKDLAAHPGPAGWDKWGGWAAGPQLEATGGFRTVKLDGKWWIVDPDGHLWWSHGPVRVTPSGGITPLDGHENWFARLPKADEPEALFYTTRDELLYPYYGKRGLKRTYDFSAQNIRRKYGENWFETWADLAHRRLRSWSCNTIANSSDKRICLMGRTPYTERFEIHARPIAGHKGGWWEFCDPFDPSFRAEAKRMTQVYREEFEDPWCLGFFVDNEHFWGEPHTFGVSALKSPADQPCKREFVKRLQAKYGEIAKLNAAWKATYASWEGLLALAKEPPDVAAAKPDLEAFSAAIAEAYYRTIREELKRAAPGKLYLGCRWAGGAPAFTVKAAAKYCDVLSYNVYRKEMSGFKLPEGVDAPILIGEFHFGALDRGPFCPGLILLKDQNDRAATYRNYVKTSLEHPQIVGVHWHQFSDQSTAGRFDGENMQVGWTDVCDTPYRETVEAIRDIGARLYEIRFRAKVSK